MEWKYSCPKCTAIVNPAGHIVLLARHEGREVLLAFHPEPGNYEVGVPENVQIRPGEVWGFFCPACHASLRFAGNESLAALDMTDGKGEWHKVVFSCVAGERGTVVISRGKELTMTKYGADLSKYDHKVWVKFI